MIVLAKLFEFIGAVQCKVELLATDGSLASIEVSINTFIWKQFKKLLVVIQGVLGAIGEEVEKSEPKQEIMVIRIERTTFEEVNFSLRRILTAIEKGNIGVQRS